jgi:hypothetical protein
VDSEDSFACVGNINVGELWLIVVGLANELELGVVCDIRVSGTSVTASIGKVK